MRREATGIVSAARRLAADVATMVADAKPRNPISYPYQDMKARIL